MTTYSNTWSVTSPLDTSDADAIASDMRQLRLDLQERINSIIGVDIATPLADPVVDGTHNITDFRAELDVVNPMAQSQSLSFFIPGIDCYTNQPITGTDLTNNFPAIEHNQATISTEVDMIYSLRLPVGAVITNIITYLLFSAGGNSLSATLNKFVLSTGTQSTITNTFGPAAITTIQAISWGATFTVAVDTVYALLLKSNPATSANTRIVGHNIAYTSANANVRI